MKRKKERVVMIWVSEIESVSDGEWKSERKREREMQRERARERWMLRFFGIKINSWIIQTFAGTPLSAELVCK